MSFLKMPVLVGQAAGDNAMQLAGEQIAQMRALGLQGTPSRRLSWGERVRGRTLARPGPKPRLAEQTYRGRYSALGNFMATHKEFRPQRLEYDTLDRMRRNGQVALGLAIKRSPIFAALREAEIKCEEPDVQAFLAHVFQKPYLMRLLRTSLTAFVFGVGFHEKVWETRNLHVTWKGEEGELHVAYDGYALVPKKYKLNDVRTIKDILVQPKTQDFDGYVQHGPPGQQDITVDPWKAFVFALNTEYGGLWGEPSLWVTYPYWYYMELFRALQADWLRTRAINPLTGRYPIGVSENQDGNEVDNATWGGDVIRAVWDAMVVMLPNTRDSEGDYEWDYSELRLSADAGEIYQRAIDNLGVMILRSLIVPERTVTQATTTGGYNEAMAHLDAFFESAKPVIADFVRHVDDYILPQIVEWNFLDRFPERLPRAYLDARIFSEQLKMKYYNLLIALVQNDRPDAAIVRHIAITSLLEWLGIPVASLSERAETEEVYKKVEPGNGAGGES